MVMANRVREVREALGYSQGTLARLADTTRETVNAIENGRSKGSQTVMLKLSRALKTPLDYLFFDATVKRSARKTGGVHND